VASFYYVLLAGALAALTTYLDLNTVFDIPPHELRWPPWLRLQLWWCGFILVNAVIAGVLFLTIGAKSPFSEMAPWIAAVSVGAGYSALVRLQFTTLSIHGKDTPIGVETLYEALKDLIHRRINRIIRAWRMEQSTLLAAKDIDVLRQTALTMVGSDSLLTDDQRTSTTNWINTTADDAATPEYQRKVALALYLITERKS
jgi:hypothetical protein